MNMSAAKFDKNQEFGRIYDVNVGIAKVDSQDFQKFLRHNVSGRTTLCPAQTQL